MELGEILQTMEDRTLVAAELKEGCAIRIYREISYDNAMKAKEMEHLYPRPSWSGRRVWREIKGGLL